MKGMTKIEMKQSRIHRGWIISVVAICCCVLMLLGEAKGQDNAAVTPAVQQKSQEDLQAIQNFLSSPPTTMLKSKGMKVMSQKDNSSGEEELPNWLKELKTKSKEEAMLQILIMKNELFQLNQDMPVRRKRLNVESFIGFLGSVLNNEDFSRLKNNEELLKQLDLFVEETPENQ
ncbi:hypothetical protein [Sphingobacterium wenxiniae]|uniref:Uncharacterized protein n=1 Tax=Sphingobacterium wenxiniae TaxID=683125 RepID=A0A1I6VYQ9_9SPHI|nr:hypothetical protein [Sphingobacterium wenxiniae]SFT18534.1 hypothetical protein SAMN05660206_11941 [Sphingobacterium wenxiniae]